VRSLVSYATIGATLIPSLPIITLFLFPFVQEALGGGTSIAPPRRGF
jgi:hypothetical protein